MNERLISSKVFKDGEIVNIEYLDFLPDDLVLSVSNFHGSICRIVRKDDHSITLKPIYSSTSRRFRHWCVNNCDMVGGSITISGLYPIVNKFPKWLKNEIKNRVDTQ